MNQSRDLLDTNSIKLESCNTVRALVKVELIQNQSIYIHLLVYIFGVS